MKLASLLVGLTGFSISAGCAAGLGDDNSDGEQDVGSTQYVLIQDFAGIDQFAWFDLAHRVNAEFEQVCGATACSAGELGAVRPLTFDCAVSSIRGLVKDCTWTFGAAKTAVDATNAAIKVDRPTFQCHVHPAMYARALVSTLSGAETAILQPLPGMDGSLADSLATCFTNPIGSTPYTVATSPVTYVSAASYYTTAAGQARWKSAVAALVHGFDNVCGDTFCGGDMGDLQALDLTCAITKSTGNVKSCTWTFAGSYVLPTTTGALATTSGSFSCPFTIHGTLNQLITTLTATDTTTDAIRRPLPGVSTTAYDALLGCLP